jgi:hypothetical protein
MRQAAGPSEEQVDFNPDHVRAPSDFKPPSEQNQQKDSTKVRKTTTACASQASFDFF